MESQEKKENLKFRGDSASPWRDSASPSGIRVVVKATDSASRPRRLDELGLNEENPKSGTWSLFKRLILFPRVPLVPLSPPEHHP